MKALVIGVGAGALLFLSSAASASPWQDDCKPKLTAGAAHLAEKYRFFKHAPAAVINGNTIELQIEKSPTEKYRVLLRQVEVASDVAAIEGWRTIANKADSGWDQRWVRQFKNISAEVYAVQRPQSSDRENNLPTEFSKLFMSIADGCMGVTR